MASVLKTNTIKNTSETYEIEVPDIRKASESYSKTEVDELANKNGIAESKLVSGDVSVVGTNLVITDRNMLFPLGISSNGGYINKVEVVIGNETIPTSIFAGITGDAYVKKIEGGAWEANTNEPSFGEVSTTGDYFLKGIWYNSSDVPYSPTITYIPYKATIANDEVVDVTAVDMPTLVTEYVKAEKVESSGDVILSGLPTADPLIAGYAWNNSGVATISSGA